ncbi:MAG: alpha/beta hydrolase [Caulobacteraceae bacterium]|nr:alpha/beta hydrolase [Caulobacteraceae bacterium]
MGLMAPQPVTLRIAEGESVSGLWQSPPQPKACLALAHGAGAGMTHRSMAAIADGLEARGVATLRYQFPYMERGGRRVDPPAVAHAVVRKAVAEARRRAGSAPLFAGGRSFGGRMTSQAQALEPLEAVRGLVFFAFPLHTAGKPSDERAAHLAQITVPMLFLQGTKDALAELDLLRRTAAGLGGRATLKLFPDADHSFHVPAKTGRTDAEVLAAILDAAAAWMAAD